MNKLGSSNTFGLWKKIKKLRTVTPFLSYVAFSWKLCHSLSWLFHQNRALLWTIMPATQAKLLSCFLSTLRERESQAHTRCKAMAMLSLCFHFTVFWNSNVSFLYFVSITISVTTEHVLRTNGSVGDQCMILQESTQLGIYILFFLS